MKRDPEALRNDILQTAQALDKPQASRPRYRDACDQHAFIMRDRCFWCGAPESEGESDARSEEAP